MDRRILAVCTVFMLILANTAQSIEVPQQAVLGVYVNDFSEVGSIHEALQSIERTSSAIFPIMPEVTETDYDSRLAGIVLYREGKQDINAPRALTEYITSLPVESLALLILNDVPHLTVRLGRNTRGVEFLNSLSDIDTDFIRRFIESTRTGSALVVHSDIDVTVLNTGDSEFSDIVNYIGVNDNDDDSDLPDTETEHEQAEPTRTVSSSEGARETDSLPETNFVSGVVLYTQTDGSRVPLDVLIEIGNYLNAQERFTTLVARFTGMDREWGFQFICESDSMGNVADSLKQPGSQFGLETTVTQLSSRVHVVKSAYLDGSSIEEQLTAGSRWFQNDDLETTFVIAEKWASDPAVHMVAVWETTRGVGIQYLIDRHRKPEQNDKPTVIEDLLRSVEPLTGGPAGADSGSTLGPGSIITQDSVSPSSRDF